MAGPRIEDVASMTVHDERTVERFAALFSGSERSSGVYSIRTGKGTPINRMATLQDYRDHLMGIKHLGIVPIRLDGSCWFAAIDVDNHGPNGRDVDPIAIERRVQEEKLPLVVCRSKSGGAHLYLFMKEPMQAARIRPLMQRWANILHLPKVEIFPKQTALSKDETGADHKSVFGNWINIAYQNASETLRYAIGDGKQMTLDQFLDHAEARRWVFTDDDMLSKSGINIKTLMQDGPPCVQTIFENKLEEGNRNNALFQVGVFLKRAGLDADEFNAKISDYNAAGFVKPLSPGEVRKVALSTFNKEYNYRCSEEPNASVCNREMCLKRKFGISGGDVLANEVPDIERVVKTEGTGVKWQIHFSGKMVNLTTEDLFDYKRFKMRVFEQLHVVLRPLKQLEWERHIQALTTRPMTIKKVETADDVVRSDLMEYLKRTSVDMARAEDDRRRDLTRGMPSLISLKSAGPDPLLWVYAFKTDGFIDWLVRRKKLSGPRHEMYVTVGRILGEDARRSVRIGDRIIKNIWTIEKDNVDNEPIAPRDVTTEY